MGAARLYLWTLVYPSAWLPGLVGAWIAYRGAHPRPTPRCGGVVAEAWRAYALAAAVPGLLLGVEAYLWLARFEYRAPLLATGLPASLGLLLVAWSPVPVVLAACRGHLGDRPATSRAAALAAAGSLLVVAAPGGQARSWTAITEAASQADPAAVAAVVRLEGYGYAKGDAATAALDAALPTAPDVLALWRRSKAGELVLDHAIREWAAVRLQEALQAQAPVHWGDEAVAAVADLTADGARVLAAYRAAYPEAVAHTGGMESPPAGDAKDLHPPGTRAPPAVEGQAEAEAVATHALCNAGPEAVAAVLAVAETYVGRRPFSAGMVTALAAHVDDSGPVGPMAVRLLFRNASRSSLRVVLPRFLDQDAPEWGLLVTHCPKRTAELRLLVEDPDPQVAQAAAAVLAYVRQYCVSSRPITG